MIADKDGCIRHSVRRMKQLFSAGRKLDQYIRGLLALIRARGQTSTLVEHSLALSLHQAVENLGAHAQSFGGGLAFPLIFDFTQFGQPSDLETDLVETAVGLGLGGLLGSRA